MEPITQIYVIGGVAIALLGVASGVLHFCADQKTKSLSDRAEDLAKQIDEAKLELRGFLNV